MTVSAVICVSASLPVVGRRPPFRPWMNLCAGRPQQENVLLTEAACLYLHKTAYSQRNRKEVRESQLTSQERELLSASKSVEMQKIIVSGAIRFLSPEETRKC